MTPPLNTFLKEKEKELRNKLFSLVKMNKFGKLTPFQSTEIWSFISASIEGAYRLKKENMKEEEIMNKAGWVKSGNSDNYKQQHRTPEQKLAESNLMRKSFGLPPLSASEAWELKEGRK